MHGRPPDEHLKHLLRRTEFVVRPQRLAHLQTLPDWEAAVDDVLDLRGNSLWPGRGPNAYFDNVDLTGENGAYDGGWKQYAWAAGHGIDYAARGGSAVGRQAVPAEANWRALQEKMVAFWHGHLVTSWSEIHLGVHLLWELHSYRRQALGSLRTLLQEMAIAPAMLVYLSNSLSYAGAPNENFARELMELFTMGVGHYDQADVAEVARAWTGYNYDYPTQRYVFNADRHDDGLKTIFGITDRWTGPQVIDAILRPGSSQQLATARRLTAKLWSYLVGTAAPSDADVLAQVLIDNKMVVGPLVKAILMHPGFVTPEAVTGAVRSPFEWLVAIAYHTGMPGLSLRLIDRVGPQIQWERRSALTGQLIYQPPNVSGWRSHDYWLGAAAISGRAQLAITAADYVIGAPAANKPALPTGATVGEAVDIVGAYFGVAYPAGGSTRPPIVAAFGGENAVFRTDALHELLVVTMLTPEFNLA